MRYHGSCLCKAVVFEIEAKDPLPIGHCHCSACRKSHGADFTTATIVKDQQLNILQGQDQISSYESSPNFQREFCGLCGSRLFVKFVVKQDNDETVFYTVAANALDKVANWRKTAHIYTADKAPWCTFDDDLPNFPGASEWRPKTQ